MTTSSIGSTGTSRTCKTRIVYISSNKKEHKELVARPGAQPDGEAVLAQLKTQLANFKIPKRCFVAAELPRNTMGKVQKNLLREQYKALFA